ncbi:MAG: hypothetical protein ACOCVA_07855 [Prolixibacteraceae bacterium]
MPHNGAIRQGLQRQLAAAAGSDGHCLKANRVSRTNRGAGTDGCKATIAESPAAGQMQ